MIDAIISSFPGKKHSRRIKSMSKQDGRNVIRGCIRRDKKDTLVAHFAAMSTIDTDCRDAL